MSKTTTVKKAEPVALALPSNVGEFSLEEINSIESFSQYLADFYRVRADGSQLQIIDKEENAVKTAASLKGAIILYSHWVYRLTRGATEGLTTDRDSWSDEQKQTVAKSYGSPFFEPRSRGNFDLGGFGEYLDDAEKRKFVDKRLFFYLALPKVIPAGQLAVATFGSTAGKSFNPLLNQVKALGVPMGFVKVDISLTQDKNDSGKVYQRPQFDLATAKGGALETTAKDAAGYREKILPFVERIKERHADEMTRIEGQSMDKAYSSQTVTIEAETQDAPPMGAHSMTDEDLPF